MLFSVIIPTFNRLHLLKRTLGTVEEQVCKDFEIIVVDDGSTDRTLEWLRQRSGRIHVLTQPNKGPGAARNLGAEQAKGEYLAFLDSDDLWFPWTLKVFAGLIERYRSPALLCAAVAEFRDESEVSKIVEAPLEGHLFSDYLASSQTRYYIGSGMAVVKRDVFLNSGGFRRAHSNSEDHDLALRLGTAPGFVQILAPQTLGWRRHLGSATGDCRKSYEGTHYLINQEIDGAYPGGSSRKHERRQIICRHARPVILECLRQRMNREAWDLYRATLRWHIGFRRWRFLFAYPAISIFAAHGPRE